MRLLVCFLFVITNISDNGRASLDIFVPSMDSLMLEDSTKNADTSCYRPCKLNVKPKRCFYKLTIEPLIKTDGKLILSINKMSPGPPIHVCANDIVAVEVVNKVPGQELAMHWHGIEQRGTPYMDGVPMVTQCPIGYGSTYKYAFIASAAGTFFYHADSVSHHSDGVYGSLIVNQPTPLEFHASLYDYDRSMENTILIGATFPKLMTGSLEDVSQMKPDNIVINGEVNHKIIAFQDFAYRLRFINAIGIDCPVKVDSNGHEMIVIATDGRPVKMVNTRAVKLYPGERMDVVVRMVLSSKYHIIRVQGLGMCENLTASSTVLFNKSNHTRTLDEEKIIDDGVYGQMLESTTDVISNNEAKFIYLGIDRNQSLYTDVKNDFRYISDAFEKKPYYPAPLFLSRNGVVTINGKSFLYPNAPLLLAPRDIKRDTVCLVGEEEKIEDIQCVHMLNAVESETLEIALVNEGFGSNDSFTFYMHGGPMQVISTGQNIDQTPLSKGKFLQILKENKIKRNPNPPIKDTVTVPNKGYTIVRIKLDHPGTWMLECRSCRLYSLPTAIVINVPRILPKVILDSLPKCGNYRPPDILLN